jgi:FkbM family methyltransferase
MILSIDRFLANKLPGNFLKDFYPRAMRRLSEYGLIWGESVVTTRHGFKIKVNRLDGIKWYIYYYNQFEPSIGRAWRNLLNAGDTVVDIGGNIGYHAMLASKCVGETGKVHTFEPSKRIFDEQASNISLNNMKNIEAHRCAVSSEPGELVLYYAGENNQGNSSIISHDARSQGETVKAICFSDIMKMEGMNRLKLIKIDVEGAEEFVLKGLIPCLNKLPEQCVIFLEISEENAGRGASIIAPLIANGFEARSVENNYTTAFYRANSSPVFSPLEFKANEICDVVLCRNPEQFARMAK